MTDAWQKIGQLHLAEESRCVADLIERAALTDMQRRTIEQQSLELVDAVRAEFSPTLMESFLAEYGLSTDEGIALMCLAEAMLRVPDAETIDDLIEDKIASHNWGAHLGDSGSVLVNASTWGLMLTGQVLQADEPGIVGTVRGLVKRLGEPVIRTAILRVMQQLGEQFVLGRSIEEALDRGRSFSRTGYRYSFDMLGEAAKTLPDAASYFDAYLDAIQSLPDGAAGRTVADADGISVKLSALHPRYEPGQTALVLPEIAERLLTLCVAAKAKGIGLNIDAEEADRLELSLLVIEAVFAEARLAGWDGFGVVVQAYSKRAPAVLDWLHELCWRHDRRMMVRLVKGAYWDSEIKQAQVMGLEDFPVFTRKAHTDVSYLACARQLMRMRPMIYPQFATHNAHTIAAVLELAEGDSSGFELQRLHGMGETVHDVVRARHGVRCRIYAPVGTHEDLLAYLVRRLLENGANSSFVHQIVDTRVPAEDIVRDPFQVTRDDNLTPHPDICPPAALFAPARQNSTGRDIVTAAQRDALQSARRPFLAPYCWDENDEGRAVINPADWTDVVGNVHWSSPAAVGVAVDHAARAAITWRARTDQERRGLLFKIADLYEAHFGEFYALLARESGKTILDAIGELREAVDFLRYYGAGAAQLDPTRVARGVIGCISPWNFPLAIFTGQIAAALAAGNAVVAKPAEQTPLIARRAIELMWQAGIPKDVLHLVQGDGPNIGAALVAAPQIAGICFTGSTTVAKQIEKQLSKTAAGDAMLIAETGGLNAMIVDSTALMEQAVGDILTSAFQSAGQRCSALRMLYVQDEIAPHLKTMLCDAMACLTVDDPLHVETDIGPVIDDEAFTTISAYINQHAERGAVLMQSHVPDADGRFVPPTLIEVDGINTLEREIFGPVLHLATFSAPQLDQIVTDINRRGFGLTFGLHTRIDSRVQHVVDKVAAGNLYINRNQIGAVVGSQPFGGEGLSGTGPKAGGPAYLRKFRQSIMDDHGDTAPADTLDANVVEAALQTLSESPVDEAGNRIARLRQRLRGRAASAMANVAALDQGPVDLPGPTGESNQYSLHPLGTVLCLGTSAPVLLDQVVQALATGNRVLAVAPAAKSTLSALRDSRLPLIVLNGTIDGDLMRELKIDGVALSGDVVTLKGLRQAAADRSGGILRFISEPVAPIEYVIERSLCIDTTAAGGNATLLAQTG